MNNEAVSTTPNLESDSEKRSARASVCDVAIAGGGLAGGLFALRLSQLRPDLRVRVFESGDRLGGEHTWCFHDSDLEDSARAWVLPLVTKSWPLHTLRFPGNETHVRESAYHAIRSSDFHERLTARLGDRIQFGARIASLEKHALVLADGERIEARCVVDARGFVHEAKAGAVAWQKFVGLDVELARPHGLLGPILMDADVEQIDGYRFLYALPWSEKQILLEDTVYSSRPDLDFEKMEARIRSYATSRGWAIASISRREHGCLPLPIRKNWNATPASPVPALGAAAGFFHATTGYSLPDTVRTVERVAALEKMTTDAVELELRSYGEGHRARQNFYRLLNRMLFHAMPAERRYEVLRHFYRLPARLVDRFYAGQTTWTDRLRILAHRPPVPVPNAIRCLAEHSWEARA